MQFMISILVWILLAMRELDQVALVAALHFAVD